MTHKKKWRLFAPLGLATTGMGLSFLGHSIGLKLGGAPFITWFIWGTFSLALFNAGLAMFGEAVKHRTLHDLQKP